MDIITNGINLGVNGIKKISGATSSPLFRRPLLYLNDTFELVTSRNAREQAKLFNILNTASDEDVFKELAAELHRIGKKNFPKYYELLKEAFSDTGARVTGRVKEPSSIEAKLERRADKIFSGRYNITSVVPDLYGCKLVTKGKPGEIERVVRKIEALVDSGEVLPRHFVNHGENPYLSSDQVKRLLDKGFTHSESIEKKAGFTGVNLYFKDKFDVSMLEVQLTGEKTNLVNLKEHSITLKLKARQQNTV